MSIKGTETCKECGCIITHVNYQIVSWSAWRRPPCERCQAKIDAAMIAVAEAAIAKAEGR